LLQWKLSAATVVC